MTQHPPPSSDSQGHGTSSAIDDDAGADDTPELSEVEPEDKDEGESARNRESDNERWVPPTDRPWVKV